MLVEKKTLILGGWYKVTRAAVYKDQPCRQKNGSLLNIIEVANHFVDPVSYRKSLTPLITLKIPRDASTHPGDGNMTEPRNQESTHGNPPGGIRKAGGRSRRRREAAVPTTRPTCGQADKKQLLGGAPKLPEVLVLPPPFPAGPSRSSPPITHPIRRRRARAPESRGGV